MNPAPLPVRLSAWAVERFPLDGTLLLLPISLVAYGFGAAIVGTEMSLRFVAAAAGLWAFYVMLRVIDEHKGFQADLFAHPGRVLQSGQVTLGHLKAVGAVALAVQLGASLSGGRPALTWWALTVAWTVLASYDFFIGRFLADRPILHQIVRLPLSGLACLWIAQLGAGHRPLPMAAIWLAVLGTLLPGSIDLIRRLEPGDIVSYSKALGLRWSCGALAGTLLAVTGVLDVLIGIATGEWLLAIIVLGIVALPAHVALLDTAIHDVSTRRVVWLVPFVLLAQLAVTATLLIVQAESSVRAE